MTTSPFEPPLPMAMTPGISADCTLAAAELTSALNLRGLMAMDEELGKKGNVHEWRMESGSKVGFKVA